MAPLIHSIPEPTLGFETRQKKLAVISGTSGTSLFTCGSLLDTVAGTTNLVVDVAKLLWERAFRAGLLVEHRLPRARRLLLVQVHRLRRFVDRDTMVAFLRGGGAFLPNGARE